MAVKKLFQTTILIGASVVISLLVAEGFLRLFPEFLPEQAQLKLHWRAVIEKVRSERDPYIGFLYPPNTSDEISHGDFHFSYTTDEKGFRNSGAWPKSADIVAVGDSMVFGYGVENDQGWLALLSAKYPDKRIVNLGLIGASPQQYSRVYETFGDPLKPKLLLYCLFPGNDIDDARRFDDWLKAGSPGNYDVWRFFEGQTPESTTGLRYLLGKSYLVAFLRETLNNISVSEELRGKTFELADGNRVRLIPSLVAQTTERGQPGKPAYELVMNAIEQTQALTAKSDTQLLVLLIPTKEEIYLPVFGEPSPDPIGPFAAALEERGIAHLDMTPYFQERAKQGKQLYFELDGHPNAAGYQLMADAVSAYLENHAEQYNLAAHNQ